VPILLGLGLKELSANPQAIPLIKNAVRMLNVDQARKFADQLLQQTRSSRSNGCSKAPTALFEKQPSPQLGAIGVPRTTSKSSPKTVKPGTTISSRRSTKPAWCSWARRSSRCARAGPTSRTPTPHQKGEVYVHQMHISPYPFAYYDNHDPLRVRKLLLHAHEINSSTAK
jgi:hypothetical protein